MICPQMGKGDLTLCETFSFFFLLINPLYAGLENKYHQRDFRKES